MKLTFDMHTHTISGGHCYSTLQENIAAAKEAGLTGLGFSEHGPAMPGGPHPYFFGNFKVIPRQYGNLRLYCGVEANIMDYDGKLDLSDKMLEKMDFVIASMHIPCVAPGSEAQNTQSSIMAMRNPYVKILGHPDDSRYLINREEIVLAAKEEQVAIEINNSSLNPLSTRQGARENISELLTLCKKYQVPVIVNTDSHISYTIGHFEDALALIEELEFPKHLILNADPVNIDKVVNVK